MMRDAHMDAKDLARASGGNQPETEETVQLDKSAAQAAHHMAEQHKHEEEIAATRMQSMYRGFRDKKRVRAKREEAELKQREELAAEARKKADDAAHTLEIQTSFQSGGIERSYLSSTRNKDSPSRRSPGKSRAAPKAVLAPTLVDKKANMTAVQKKACIVLEEIIKKWALSYARAVELAPGAEKTGALEIGRASCRERV